MKNPFVVAVFTTLVAAYFGESNSSWLTSKIIDGEEATWSSTSYTAAVEYNKSFCGAAALISYRHALTSPFVTIDIPCDDFKNAHVIAGNTILKKGQAFPIDAIKYSEKGKDFPDIRNDANFTIIYLKKFIPHILKLIPIRVSPDYIRPGTEAIISGWGATMIFKKLDRVVLSETLKQLSLTVLDPKDCLVKTNHRLSELQLCARESSGRGAGPHHDDIGDPLVINDNHGIQLIGITHYISKRFKYDPIFTRLHDYQHYIDKIIEQPLTK